MGPGRFSEYRQLIQAFGEIQEMPPSLCAVREGKGTVLKVKVEDAVDADETFNV
jgi:hypothetical protein